MGMHHLKGCDHYMVTPHSMCYYHHYYDQSVNLTVLPSYVRKRVIPASYMCRLLLCKSNSVLPSCLMKRVIAVLHYYVIYYYVTV